MKPNRVVAERLNGGGPVVGWYVETVMLNTDRENLHSFVVPVDSHFDDITHGIHYPVEVKPDTVVAVQTGPDSEQSNLTRQEQGKLCKIVKAMREEVDQIIGRCSREKD